MACGCGGANAGQGGCGGHQPAVEVSVQAPAVHEVLLETQACASYELELVRAQDRIAHPRVRFEATPIGF